MLSAGFLGPRAAVAWVCLLRHPDGALLAPRGAQFCWKGIYLIGAALDVQINRSELVYASANLPEYIEYMAYIKFCKKDITPSLASSDAPLESINLLSII